MKTGLRVLGLGLLFGVGLTMGVLDGGGVLADEADEGTGAVLAGAYRIRDHEMLHDIARRFDVGFVELRAANPGVDPWLPGKGTVIRLPTMHLAPAVPHEGIVINLAELRLYYFPEQAGTALSFPIGIGREGWSTPLGKTRVVRKRKDPVWTVPASIRAQNPALPLRVKAGPNNPLGAYALDLGLEGYLIHGTNLPDGVGRRVSHGCIRLYPEDIERLFDAVTVGTPVRIIDQPVKAAWRNGELFVEAHATPPEADMIEIGKRPHGLPPYFGDAIARVRHVAGDRIDKVDMERVVDVIVAREGIPVRVTQAAPVRQSETDNGADRQRALSVDAP